MMDETCKSCGSAEARDFLVATRHHGVVLAHEEDATSPVEGPLCQRCEIVPRNLTGPGTLHLRFPLTHSLAKILTYLKHSPFKFTQQRGVLSIHVPDADLAPLAAGLSKALLTAEQEDTQAVFRRDGELLQIEDYFNIVSLSRFCTRAQGNWLLDMMRDHRVKSVFQPIVRSVGGHDIFGYECLLRGYEKDGRVTSPATMMEVARSAGILFQLDLEARRVAISGAAEHGITQKIFVNFGPTAIYDPENCLLSTVKLVDEVHLDRAQVIFEVIETDHIDDTSHLQNIVRYYRDNGFGVALDDLGSGYSSLNMLNKLRPDYVKLDMDLTRDVHRDPYKALLAKKLLEVAHELELLTIAEGVECRDEYEWVRDHGADFVQGFYFAHPSSPPPVASKW